MRFFTTTLSVACKEVEVAYVSSFLLVALIALTVGDGLVLGTSFLTRSFSFFVFLSFFPYLFFIFSLDSPCIFLF
ncbi:hypothetical protein BDV40DRAFT_269164 [Aspergillus tamarii]|uniref:Uncharacterized protein n=1 Tax=Aspergillus tamarii TaxID=41984 RepID=A0A5N6URE1_ASPTM|nr:hypothetical protein BDV40DRAFT_269164 [Aspergillus tamarii]